MEQLSVTDLCKYLKETVNAHSKTVEAFENNHLSGLAFSLLEEEDLKELLQN